MAATRDLSSELVATIYDAAIDPSLWPQVVVSVANAFDAVVFIGIH